MKANKRHNEFGVDLTGDADNVDRAVVALNLHSQAIEALKDLLRAYEQVLPGIKYIACQDYQIVNDGPAAARRVIALAERGAG